jgi:hypothetical protein
MSRIYVITDKETTLEHYVRAKSLRRAIQAVAGERYTGKPASTEDLFQAYKVGVEVLDAAGDAEVAGDAE